MEIVSGPLSVAVVGYGSIGKKHVEIISKIRPNCRIFVVRRNIKNSEAFHSNFLAVGSIEECLNNDIHAAIVCSPASLHIEQSIDFVQRGIPVFIEKPLSTSAAGLDRLLRVASKNNVLVYVGYVLRFLDSLRTFKNLIQDGHYGDLVEVRVNCQSYLPDWRPNTDYRESVSARKDLGGGALLELSHDVDYSNWIFGQMRPVSASMCKRSSLEVDVEDTVDIDVTLEASVPLSMHLDFCSPRTDRSVKVKTVRGTLELNIIANTIQYTSNQGAVDTIKFNQSLQEAYEKQMCYFLSCVESGSKDISSLISGIEIMKLIDGIRALSAVGGKD